MLCSQLVMRKDGVDPEELRPLPCRSWSCEWCAPKRRRQLMARAAKGEPTALLTLTVNVAVGDGPAHRRDMLHDAWKRLVKRINRQFQLPPERRWQLTAKTREPTQQSWLLKTTAKTPQAKAASLPYFAFLERTKRGEPHLHILIRSPYIPQDWLSEQMDDMLGSPIVWIEKIENSKHAIAYVTKYVTKAPAQWGNKKRYWQSRNWAPQDKDDDDEWRSYDGPVTVERISWADLSIARSREGWTHEITAEGWHRFWRPGRHPDWQNLHPWVLHHARKEDGPRPQPP